MSNFISDRSLPGWSFTAEEVSYGVWRINGRHNDGRSVSRTESGDSRDVLNKCMNDARVLPARRPDAVDAELEKRGWRKVATGKWFYDRIVPMPISVWAKPAHLAFSRFDEDDQIVESRSIPETLDGYLYCCWPSSAGEHLTVEAAKAAADAQPWGPIIWDQN